MGQVLQAFETVTNGYQNALTPGGTVQFGKQRFRFMPIGAGPADRTEAGLTETGARQEPASSLQARGPMMG